MYITQTVENQEVMWLPTNYDTQTILYDTKFLKSVQGRYPALKWTVTKIEDTAVQGITKFTLAQTQFDASVDNVEEMIADYYEGTVAPTPPIENSTNYIIEYSGLPIVKVGGSYKKFVLKEEKENQIVDVMDSVKWTVDFQNNDDKLICEINGNMLKIKCVEDYSLIGKVFSVKASCNNISSCIDVEVASL